ncbi:5665_t:CDS:2 [Ambispora leptoticha]|uniref:5665_t:CDS:1 n=1 Tax=Ambispora leptoticha TaxID=144679 RepID=A0A9N9F8G3_9GLOM|nr:5665_t:CDS:2 [Ambispora leptoticha]
MHRTNGEEELGSGTSTIQVRKIAVSDALSSSETVMDTRSERSNPFSNHQWRAETNGNKDTRSHNYNSCSVGRPLMFIYHEPEEVPEQEVQVQLPDLPTPAFGANCPDLGVQCQHASDNDKPVSKKSHDSISTGYRPPAFPWRPGWEHLSESGELESWELCGSKSVVSSSRIEARSSNQNSYDLGPEQNGETPLQKLPEVPRQLLDLLKDDRFGFHEITSEDSLDEVWHADILSTSLEDSVSPILALCFWTIPALLFGWSKELPFYPDNILCILANGKMISEKELVQLVKQDVERILAEPWKC